MNTEVFSSSHILSIPKTFRALVLLTLLTIFSNILASAIGVERWVTFFIVFCAYFATVLYIAVKQLPPTTSELIEQLQTAQQTAQQNDENLARMFEVKEKYRLQTTDLTKQMGNLQMQFNFTLEQKEKERLQIIESFEAQLDKKNKELEETKQKNTKLEQVNSNAEKTIEELNGKVAELEQTERRLLAELAKIGKIKDIFEKYPGLVSSDTGELKDAYTSRVRALAASARVG